jgi:hypothetical protein
MDKLYSSAAAEASAVASASKCFVDEVIATNTSAGVLYLHIFDSATVPADTAAPDVCIAVAATSTVSWDPERGSAADKGVSFDNGCAVCLSSTAATKTVAGAVGVFTVRGSV